MVRRHADIVPGALDVISALRERGIRVGGDSGYNPPIMEALLEEAGKAGLKIDVYAW
jgi:phosphonoacetaldehyde hydrolase